MFEIFGFWAGVTLLTIPPTIFVMDVVLGKITAALLEEGVPQDRYPSWITAAKKLSDYFSGSLSILSMAASALGWMLYAILHFMIAVGAVKGTDGKELTLMGHGMSPVTYVSELSQLCAPFVGWVGIILLAYLIWSYTAVGYAKFVSMSLKVEDKLNG